MRLKHNDGSIVTYTHLQGDSQLVNIGDFVGQGDPIANSGNSGTRNPHLHFAVYENEDSASLPITFRNAQKNRNGLIEDESYPALSFTVIND